MKKLLAFILAMICSLHIYAQTTVDYSLETLGTTDTFVKSSSPTNYFGTGAYIQAGGWGDTHKALLMFGISSLPALAPEERVSVWLYNASTGGSSTPTQVRMAMNNASFSDTTTWNTHPGTLLPLKTVNVAAYGYWTEFDITEYYLAWKSGSVTNYGIQLIPVNTSNNFDFFAASGSATPNEQKPFLRITSPVITDTLLETLSPVDTFVRNSGGSGGFPTNTVLQVGGWGDIYKSFIKFDVSTLPVLATGDKALLRLYNTVQPGSQTPTQMNMAMNSTAFSNATVWATSPVASGTPRLVNVSAYGYWTDFDITDYYNQWKAGTTTNNGIQFTPVNTSNNFNFFASSDSTIAAQKPLVRIAKMNPSNPSLFLSFPLDVSIYPRGAYEPHSITSILDHYMDKPYEKVVSTVGGTILSFTGELFETDSTHPINNPDGFNPQACFPKKIGTGLWSNLLQKIYLGTSGSGMKNCIVNEALNYEAHPGYDYFVASGNVVRAAYGGTVVNNSNQSGRPNQKCIPKGIESGGCVVWGAVGIDHGNGYITQYLHLSNITVTEGQQVTEGMQIGFSGNKSPAVPALGAHLHFEVLKLRSGAGYTNDYMPDSYAIVDPYGFNSSLGVQDYLGNATGVPSVCLWKTGCAY